MLRDGILMLKAQIKPIIFTIKYKIGFPDNCISLFFNHCIILCQTSTINNMELLIAKISLMSINLKLISQRNGNSFFDEI